MTDENKSYKVTDRRHSTSESEATVAEEPPASEVDSPVGATVPESPVSEGGAMPPADFTTFILSLGQQAATLLSGGAPGGAPDLKGARWLISILEMLRDKTEGRRTPQETEALESILYELRMVFLERSRAGGA
jgi:hypothetical protein